MPFGSTPDAGQKQLVGSPQTSGRQFPTPQEVLVQETPTVLQTALSHANDYLLRGGTGVFPSLQAKGTMRSPTPMEKALKRFGGFLEGMKQTGDMGANSNHGGLTPTLPPAPNVKLPLLDGSK